MLGAVSGEVRSGQHFYFLMTWQPRSVLFLRNPLAAIPDTTTFNMSLGLPDAYAGGIFLFFF